MSRHPATEMAASLKWWSEYGYGYYPVQESDWPYDEAYWAKYVRYEDTEVGRGLTAARLALVDEFVPREAPIIDVGIGSGQFIKARGGPTFGHDVNPVAVDWLRARWLQAYPLSGAVNVTFWDSLEHLPAPELVVGAVESHVFVSIPLVEGRAHALGSKHFRPTEHYWYFTDHGLVRWFDDRGFSALHQSRMEEDFGREDIGTFVFRRR